MTERTWPERVRAEFAEWVLAARHAHPGLGAALDQHAAAVRESIRAAGERVGPDTLTGYLIGFWDGAHEQGWRPPRPGDPLDFAALRLSAVCLMLDAVPAR